MLRDLRPLRPGRPIGWLFSTRRNRRTRTDSGRVLTLPDEKGPRTWLRVLVCLAIAAGLGAAVVGMRALLLHSQRFALTEVRVSPLKHLDAERVIDKSGLALGKSLFAVDLAAVEQRISHEPWVQSVRVRRELPHTVAIEIVEREVRIAVALGPIYLVDERGEVFKRALPEELEGLPVVTGFGRDRYVADPARARATLRRALELDKTWRAHGTRPIPGELHHDGGQDLAASFTVYFEHAGHPVGVRLGTPDASTPDRLRRLDAVMTALDREGAHPAIIHLDQRAQLDRVAVRLVGASDVIQAL